MLPFSLVFPDLAEDEVRVLVLIRPADETPSAEVYYLWDWYCEARGCDCRRVLIRATMGRTGPVVATIGHRFDEDDPYDPLDQTALDPLFPETEVSHFLLENFERQLESTPGYRERLHRHYRMWKEVIEDPLHPLRGPLDEFEDEFARELDELEDELARELVVGLPAPRRISTKVGANAPCPCGSGRKYKKCCRG